MTAGNKAQAAARAGRYRAGGTDMFDGSPADRMRVNAREPVGGDELVDLRGIEGLGGVTATSVGGVRIGAMVTIDEVGHSELVRERAPALAATARGLATPQIRAVGTVGGNLLQATRCPYARHELIACHRTGGDGCPARSGVHDRHVVFDLGPCVAPHPSSLAVALLAYGATVEVHDAPARTIADLYGDGSDASHDHQLPQGQLLTGVVVPAPWPDERAGYHRTISRARAEWPLVEAVARVRRSGATVTDAAIAVGGVAPVPVRLPEVERHVVGRPFDDGAIADAAAAASRGATPLPGTRYKVALLEATVRHLLETLARDAA